jgi:uncharacterized protein YebE (UPF0316 family)
MEAFFTGKLGFSTEVFNFVILPLFIFLARITDVSLNTIRLMFVMSGKRQLAPLLGFFEAIIWLMAIGQIIQNLSNIPSYLAYASGFGAGTYIGMYIEGKLALGKVIVRVITRREASELVAHLQSSRFGFTNIKAEGRRGDVNVLFSVVSRKDLPELIDMINHYNPKAFYTIESVKHATDGGLVPVEEKDSPDGWWRRILNRK